MLLTLTRLLLAPFSLGCCFTPLAQIPGTAYNRSLKGFHYREWNLAELMRVGIATPASKLNITGLCQCTECRRGWPVQA